jgi:predicted PurR-regulated permease PerM
MIQKSIDNLKRRPKDERTAVAGGISVAVAAVLFIVWVVYFFHKIQSGAVAPSLTGGNDFSNQALQQAQSALQQEGSATNDQLMQLRQQINSQQQGPVQQQVMQINQAGNDQFGLPTTGY